jgi:hypothetical protein
MHNLRSSQRVSKKLAHSHETVATLQFFTDQFPRLKDGQGKLKTINWIVNIGPNMMLTLSLPN